MPFPSNTENYVEQYRNFFYTTCMMVLFLSVPAGIYIGSSFGGERVLEMRLNVLLDLLATPPEGRLERILDLCILPSGLPDPKNRLGRIIDRIMNFGIPPPLIDATELLSNDEVMQHLDHLMESKQLDTKINPETTKCLTTTEYGTRRYFDSETNQPYFFNRERIRRRIAVYKDKKEKVERESTNAEKGRIFEYKDDGLLVDLEKGY